MMTRRPTGVIVPLITPFTAAGDVDAASACASGAGTADSIRRDCPLDRRLRCGGTLRPLVSRGQFARPGAGAEEPGQGEASRTPEKQILAT